MIKTEKIVHVKTCRGRKVRVVREHYLRERVPCYSALCQAGCAHGKVSPARAQTQQALIDHRVAAASNGQLDGTCVGLLTRGDVFMLSRLVHRQMAKCCPET